MMISLRRLMSVVGAVTCLFGSHAAALAQSSEYGRTGPWTILTEAESPTSCRANTINKRLQADFGQFFSIVLNGRDWQLWTDYRIYDRMPTTILLDGRSYKATFEQNENVAVASVGQDLIDAMRSGRSINLNLDPEGPKYALKGAGAAIDLVEECVRGSGAQNAGNSGTNDYGGYDIGGLPEAEESDYGAVRGWRVVAAEVAGNFAYCAGETDDRGTSWRMGWDGMQWQVAVAADVQPDWNGTLDVDGEAGSISGSAGGGWALLWLGMQEVDYIRNGSMMTVDTGNAKIRHPLRGTAALITKIEECVKRKGGGKSAAASEPAEEYADGSGGGADNSGEACPDDGPRLPFTGICAGRAVNYLTGTPTYGDYLPDPKCVWVVNEVQVVEDALLYRALRCKGVTAQLEYAGGAHWAQLMVARSALNAAYGSNATDPEKPLVWFNVIDPNNIEHDLDMRSREGVKLKGRSCAIRKADPAISPDGYVFNITSDDPKYAESQEGPMAPQCGPFSEGDGVVRFWRVLGDYAFLFDLSADIYQDIDPNTVTLLKKDSSGSWAAVQ